MRTQNECICSCTSCTVRNNPKAILNTANGLNRRTAQIFMLFPGLKDMLDKVQGQCTNTNTQDINAAKTTLM